MLLKLCLIIAGLAGLIILAFAVKRKLSKAAKTTGAAKEHPKELDEKNGKKKEFDWKWKDYAAISGGVALVIYLAVISFWIAICLIVCLVAVTMIIARLVMTIPTNNIAIKTLFGKRRKGYSKEGLCLRLPFEELPLYPVVPIPISDIKVEATSKDDLKLMLYLSFEFCYDPSIMENGICVFSGYDNDDAIIKGITDELKVIAKSIVGVSTAQQINVAQTEINLLLNVIARLSDKNAHLKPLHPEETVAYYKDNFAAVKEELGKEHLETTEHSRLEEKYGIDISRVDLIIEYSDEARKILEKNKVAEEESLVSKKIIDTVEDLKKAGLSPEKAASSALLIYKKDNAKLWIKDINIAGIDRLPEVVEKAVKMVFGKEEKNA